MSSAGLIASMKSTDSPSATRQALRTVLLMRGRLGRLGFLREIIVGYAAVTLVFDRYLGSGHEIPPPVALLTIPVLWLVASALIRRGHDIGAPSWFSLLLPLFMWSSALSMTRMENETALIAAAALSAGSILFFALMRPDPFDNRWGLAPKRRPPAPRQGSIDVVQ